MDEMFFLGYEWWGLSDGFKFLFILSPYLHSWPNGRIMPHLSYTTREIKMAGVSKSL